MASTAHAGAGYRQLLNQLLLAGLASLVLGLLLSWLLARHALRPLRRLAEASESAVAGDYNAQVGMAGNDELGQLSRAIDGLLAALRERSDIEGYLGNLARAGVRLPASVPPALQKLVATAERRLQAIETWNDPRGIYFLCECGLR